jgi:NAD(P)-dependent dehydrogenase (short-subunit alcohol dehydrogenase family)
MELRLDGKVAIVTGASGGFGVVYAKALAEAGAKVVAADLNLAPAQTEANKLNAQGLDCLALQVDVGCPDSTKAMAAAAIEHFGGIDILVNNAAMMAEIKVDQNVKGTSTDLKTFPLELWNKVLQVNLTGPLLCSQAVIPSMQQRGGGKIINQTSVGAYQPAGVYGVSKLGLTSLTTSLAQELGPDNINVNNLVPGFIDNAAGRKAMADNFDAMLEAMTPLKTKGLPEDFIGALLFLSSSASDWMTGKSLIIDGGLINHI